MSIFDWKAIKKQLSIPAVGRARTGLLVLGIGILLVLAWLSINTQSVVAGQRVRELEGKLDRVNHENAQLEYDIAILSQPKRIADRAAAIGLRPATAGQTTYLNVDYTPHVDVTQAPVSQKTDQSSDWLASLNDIVTWLGLSGDTHAAEASP